MTLSMIEGAEGRGQLKPGGRVVEYTGGSTSSSLAMVLGFIPSIYRGDLVDGIISVKNEDAYETARLLAKKEGIFGGTTFGANV